MNALVAYWHAHWRQLWLWLPSVVLLVLQCLPTHWLAELSFHVAAAHEGGWYRPFTGQWVHFTWYHTFYNAAALGLTGWVLWREVSPRRYAFALGWVLLWVGVWLWFSLPADTDYRGASGAVYGMVALGLWWQRHTAPMLYLAALALLSGKIAYEQTHWFDPSYLSEQLGGDVAGDSHLAGLVGAASLALLFRFFRRHDRRSTT